MFAQLLNLFISDATVKTLGVLLAVDIVVGIAASLKAKTFSFGYLHAFLIDDVLAKLVPFFAIYAAAKAGLSNDWFEGLRDVIFATLVAGFMASILKSLQDLGFTGLPPALTKEKKIA